MPITFLDLKNRIRSDVWSAGEPKSRVAAHNHMFVDALVEIQKYVACFQQNNTHLIPHCATHYKCGMTSFDLQRGRPNRLSVIAKKIDPTTGDTEEDIELADSLDLPSGVTSQSWGGIAIAQIDPITAESKESYDWETANTDNPAYWKFTFSERKIANSFSLVMGYDAYTNQPCDFAIQASNDNTNWTTLLLEEDKNDWASGDTLTFDFDNTGAYLHYRIRITPSTIDDPLFNTTINQFTLSGEQTPSAVSYTDEYDWCGEVFYDQVEPCAIANYFDRSFACGSCLPIGLYFGISDTCLGGKGCSIPVPTDEGVPAGLPILPLGFHYPQESTDATSRATKGVWAIDRGRIYIAPWIQSTETVVLRMDGIKRDWADSDLVEDDPDLIRAVKLWVQKESARDDDKDPTSQQIFERDFNIVLQDLWHECREETRVRDCEPSLARGMGGSNVALYWNDQQQFTATCPSGQTGTPVTVTIPSGTVGSSYSKTDANTRALDQARAQAQAQLICDPEQQTYWNTAQSYTAYCEQSVGAPAPTGDPVTVTVQANQYSSTVSQAVANANALAAAQALAEAQLDCTWYNRATTVELPCPAGQAEVGDGPEGYVAEGEFTSTISQTDADLKATNEAKQLANESMSTTCSGADPRVWNTAKSMVYGTFNKQYIQPGYGGGYKVCSYTIYITIQAHACSGATIGEANANAEYEALTMAQSYQQAFQSSLAPCADFTVIVPTRT